MAVDVSQHVKNSHLQILVKPNAPKNEILGMDKSRNSVRVAIAAPPEKDKANKEVIKFFSKLLKKRVEIVRGARTPEKLLKIS